MDEGIKFLIEGFREDIAEMRADLKELSEKVQKLYEANAEKKGAQLVVVTIASGIVSLIVALIAGHKV